MAIRSEFVEHVVEMLRAFGPVSARRMFGGWGLYHEGIFFALVFDETLYLKADAANARDFEARGLEPFVFESRNGGETVTTSYRRAPEEALESPEEMARWARSGYGAALRKEGARREKASARTAKPMRKTRGKAT
jgi:DNA transformation protein